MPSALVGRPGEDVEAVVSMLLCRRHKRAARRRPSQGDRGVDVAVPVDDGRIDVYQVKRYDRTPTASQWSKIKKSYDTLVEAVAAGHFTVRNWYLVMPLDESDTDEKKFTDLVAGSPFEQCEWKGLAWLDALASEYPEVVDYYLADGKVRLEQSYRDLMAVLDARASAADGADAATIADGLAALYRATNLHDPLRYDFAVSNVGDRDAFVPAEPPAPAPPAPAAPSRQHRLPEPRLIAHDREHDGLDPFQHKGSRPSSARSARFCGSAHRLPQVRSG
jgi:hypothetical protein